MTTRSPFLEADHPGRAAHMVRVSDVHLSSCFLIPGDSHWRSGFVRPRDHEIFGTRRNTGLFATSEKSFPDLPVRTNLDKAYFGGVLFPYYGHFLIESLACLPNIPDDGVPIIFMCLVNTVTNWHKEFFRDSGLGDRLIFTNKASKIHVRELIKVDQENIIRSNISRRYVDFASNIFPPSAPDGRKIYVSRTGWKNATIGGEPELEERMKAEGFEVVRPESLSIHEQVKIYDKASVVVAIEGSALHTLMLSSTPKRVIVLARRHALDFNFILQFSVQPQLHVTCLQCMKKYGADFKDSAEIDVGLAVNKVLEEISGKSDRVGP